MTIIKFNHNILFVRMFYKHEIKVVIMNSCRFPIEITSSRL